MDHNDTLTDEELHLCGIELDCLLQGEKIELACRDAKFNHLYLTWCSLLHSQLLTRLRKYREGNMMISFNDCQSALLAVQTKTGVSKKKKRAVIDSLLEISESKTLITRCSALNIPLAKLKRFYRVRGVK